MGAAIRRRPTDGAERRFDGQPMTYAGSADRRLSDALETALQRFGAMVTRIGSQHGLSSADVDELAQEIRIRLWKSLGSSEKIEEASTSYIYRAAKSAAVDMIRRRRSKGGDATISVESGMPPLRARVQEEADHAVEREELAARMREALDDLIESRRAVVRMYLAGYDRHEIAELMGWKEGKTRNLLYRGLSDLRIALAERGLGPEEET